MTPREVPLSLSADPAGSEHLSEATNGISVAPGHGEAMSGFAAIKRPTEGREEATDGIIAPTILPGHTVRDT